MMSELVTPAKAWVQSAKAGMTGTFYFIGPKQ